MPAKTNDFRHLNDLIQKGTKEIVLESDIQITGQQRKDFAKGIQIKVDELIIDGKGHTIDANGVSRIFEVIKGMVTLKNITLANTNAYNGAPIYNHDRLKVADSKIVGLGNAAYNDSDAILKFDSTEFYNDSSIIISDGKLILINTEPDFVINSHVLYLPEEEIPKRRYVLGKGKIIGFHKLDEDKEQNFTYLQHMIDKHYDKPLDDVRHLVLDDDKIDREDTIARYRRAWGAKDNLIRVKGDVILDFYSDECFRFPNGMIISSDGIIIDAQGYAIDSNGFSRVFSISADDVVIRNATLKNGRESTGGAIRMDKGSLKLFSLTFEGNCALENGGAIYNENGNLTIKRVFFNNNCAEKGGAIYNGGEIIIDYANFNNNPDNSIFNRGELILNDSNFAGTNRIENNGVLKVWNNSYENTTVSNHDYSLFKIFNKKEEEYATNRNSQMLRIVNRGKVKAYNFENNNLPPYIDIPKDDVEHDVEDVYLDDAKRHNDDVAKKAEDLIGKKMDLRDLDNRLLYHTHNILLVKGEEGIGKNTLLCRWHEQLLKGNHKSIIRLCETTSKSSTFKDLYLSIGSEAKIFDSDEEEITKEHFEFDEEFFKKLKARNIKILIISNIDKLDTFNLGSVPSGFFLVLSAGNDYDLGEKADVFMLEGFKTSEERREIIDRYFEKPLPKKQKTYLESYIALKSPVFVEILLNELSRSDVHVDLESEVKDFGDSIFSAFRHLIDILEKDTYYPKNLVRKTLALLAYSANGLDRDSLLGALENGQDQYLDAFLERISNYQFEMNSRHMIGYEDFRKAIMVKYSDDAEGYRGDLVEIYKAALQRAENNDYVNITGSDDLLNQLEMLKDYGGILEVFQTDALLDKVSPNRYGLSYKNGSFFEDSDKKIGINIANYENSSVLGDISLELLKKANKIYEDAKIKYLEYRDESNDYDLKEFYKYRDAFYEPPAYYAASAFYARNHLENFKNDNAASAVFLDEYEMLSQDLIRFFKAMSETGSKELGLSYKFEGLVAEAIRSRNGLLNLAMDLNIR